jgi:hypothetical protein
MQLKGHDIIARILLVSGATHNFSVFFWGIYYHTVRESQTRYNSASALGMPSEIGFLSSINAFAYLLGGS